MMKFNLRALLLTLAAVVTWQFTGSMDASGAETFQTKPMMTLHNYYGAYLRDDGTVFAWTSKEYNLKKLDGIRQVVFIYADDGVMSFLQSDGSLWALSGMLEDETYSKLTKIASGKSPAVLRAEYDAQKYEYLTVKNGEVWNGSRKIEGLNHIVKVANSVALKNEGSVWFINHNSFDLDVSKATKSEHGDFYVLGGAEISEDFPLIKAYSAIQINGIFNVMDIAPNGVPGGVEAMKNDGTVWTVWQGGFQAEYRKAMMIPKQRDVPSLITIKNTGNPSPVSGKTALPTTSKVFVNGGEKAFEAYNIDGSNYFKLRDIAYVLNGTAKQFEVAWNNAAHTISLTSGKPYTIAGDEMSGKSSGSKTAVKTNAKVQHNGKDVSFTVYTIDGSSYFKLQDLGAALDFKVEWDGSQNAIRINTGEGYISSAENLYAEILKEYATMPVSDGKYMIIDIDQNGVSELIVRYRIQEPTEEEYTHLYTVTNASPVEIGKYWNRSRLDGIDKDGNLYYVGSGGWQNSTLRIERISQAGKIITVEEWEMDGNSCTYITSNEKKSITQQEFMRVFDNFPVIKENILNRDWTFFSHNATN